jgi:hypothetical protein
MRSTCAIAALALSLHLAGSMAAAQTIQPTRGFTTTITVNVPAVIQFGGPYCPQGHTLSSFSTDVCLEPIEYTCTEYLCTDPTTGRQYRAPMRSGSNPSCVQNGWQTEACSNEPQIPEFPPTLKQLFELLPKVYDKGYVNAPLLPPQR